MIKEYKNLIITIGIILAVSGIFYIYHEYQIQKTQEKIKTDEITKKLQETENKLNELVNKPAPKPEVIYKTTTINNTPKDTTPKEKTVAEIVKEWSPTVVYVECEWYKNGTFWKAASGSGTLVGFKDGSVGISTNKHVVLADNKYGPMSCDTLFLNGEKYTTSGNIGHIYYFPDYDIGTIDLLNPSEYVKNILSQSNRTHCIDEPAIGDNVVILGYPGIGSSSGITATEGIISGVDGDYYITSAKIEHGNSGGVAVLAKNNCMIGIPSASVTGTVESLGRILSSKIIMSQYK